MKYSAFIFVLLFYSNLYSQDTADYYKNIKINVLKVISTGAGTYNICGKSLEILDLTDSLESSDVSYTWYENRLFISILKSLSYFCMTKQYLKAESYEYGIQVLEKGIDYLKESRRIFKKIYPAKLIDIKVFDKLYDECFNIYTDYKMKRNKNEEISILPVIKKHLKAFSDNEMTVFFKMILE